MVNYKRKKTVSQEQEDPFETFPKDQLHHKTSIFQSSSQRMQMPSSYTPLVLQAGLLKWYPQSHMKYRNGCYLWRCLWRIQDQQIWMRTRVLQTQVHSHVQCPLRLYSFFLSCVNLHKLIIYMILKTIYEMRIIKYILDQ